MFLAISGNGVVKTKNKPEQILKLFLQVSIDRTNIVDGKQRKRPWHAEQIRGADEQLESTQKSGKHIDENVISNRRKAFKIKCIILRSDRNIQR